MSTNETNSVWRDAQDGVIGAMLIEPECVPAILMATEPEDFEDFNRATYNAIRRLHTENRPIDPVVVLDVLGPEFRERILHAMKVTPTAANVMEYVQIVREQSRLDALRKLSYNLSSALDLDEARKIVAKAQALTVETRGVKPRSWAQMIDSFMETRRENKELDFLDWGIPALNTTIHAAAEGGKYILIGGDSSCGKSALMFQMAHYLSRKRRVCVFSFETEEEEMTERIASNSSQVDFGHIIRNKLSVDEWRAMNAAFSGSYKNTLDTVDAAGLTAEDVVEMTRAYRYEVIFVDYLQLVTPSGDRRDNREQQVAKISRAFKLLAKQKPRVTVVALSQLSRPEHTPRGGVKEPTLHSFRESGQLEQDADVAMIIYKPYPDAAENSPRSALRRLSIVKNKKDSLSRLNLRFDGEHQTFSYIYPEQAKRIAEMDEPEEDNPFVQTELPT